MSRQAMLEIRLFGAFRIFYRDQARGPAGDGQEVPVTSLRQQSLLAYLLLHWQTPQPRPRVAFQLWPDVSERQARNSLRNLLFQVRHIWPDLDRYIEFDAAVLRWQPQSAFVCDVHAFEEFTAQAARGPDDAARIQALEQAVALYQGDLLPGCYDEWIAPERQRLQASYAQTLHTLVALYEARHAPDQAIEHASRLIRHDPLDEAAYRRLMRLYLAAGEPNHARRIYAACVEMLERELGVDPAPETVALIEQIARTQTLNGTHAPDASPRLGPIDAPARPLADARDDPWLIGREHEWAALQARWQRAAQGQAGILLITGEAGIGKTRLAAELIHLVQRQGYAVGQANCFSSGADFAYEPVLAWLRSPDFAARRPHLADVWLAELARLLPEICAERPDLQPLAALAETWQRQRMLQALIQGILIVEQPALLFIDDLHWSDRETVQWLTFLLRQPLIEWPTCYGRYDKSPTCHGKYSSPVLVLATLRDEDVADQPWLQQALVEWRRLGLAEELPLARLSPAQTQRLAQEVTGQTIGPTIAARLYDETLGNPLFVVETARAGLAVLDEVHPSAKPLAAGESVRAARRVFPPKIQAAIESRLARLSSAALELLQLAAVIGREFPLALLIAAADQDEADALAAVEELWERRLIQESLAGAPAFEPLHLDSGAASTPYAFSHDRLREFVYQGINAVRRRVFHRRVAQALVASQSDLEGALSSVIAMHYELADSLDQAVRHYMAAALHANRIHAYYKAEQLYGQAMEIAGRLNLPARTLIHIYIERGRMLELVGQYEPAAAIYEAFVALAQRRGDRNMEAYAVLHLAACFVEPSTVHDRTRALPLLARGLRLAREADHPRVEAGMIWCQFTEAAQYGQDEEAEGYGVQGLEFCAAHELDYLAGWFLSSLAGHYALTNRHAECRSYVEQAHTVFMRFNDPAMAAGGLNHLAGHLYHQLDFDGARQAAQEAASLAQRIENPVNMGFAHLIEGLIALQQGDLTAGQRHCEECFQLSRAAAMPHISIYAHLELGRLYRLRGEIEAATAWHETAYALTQRHLSFLRHAAAAQLAADAFAAGDTARGQTFFEQAVAEQPVAALPRAWNVLAYLPEAAAARARVTGDWETAHALTVAHLAEARQRNLPLYLPILNLTYAECLLRVGEPDAARQVRDAAEAIAMEKRLYSWADFGITM